MQVDQAIVAQSLDGLWEMVKLVAGGLIAAAVTLYFTGRRQDRELERTARQLATRLIEIFERFAIACAKIPEEHRRSEAEDPYDWSGVGSVPDLTPLPEDEAGWRALEPQFAITARTFGMRIDRASAAVVWESEINDAEDTAYELERQALSLGVAALDCARDLRVRYGFDEADLGWNVRGHFEEERVRIAKTDEQRAEANREMWARMAQSSTTATDKSQEATASNTNPDATAETNFGAP